MGSKLLHDSEWVRTNYASKRFDVRVSQGCECCGRATLATVYYSITRGVYQCLSCREKHLKTRLERMQDAVH